MRNGESALSSVVKRDEAARLAPMALAGVVLAASLFLSGCSAKEEGVEAAPTVAVQVDAAENEAIQRKVIANAILYPLDQAAIVPKIAAPVKKFYVERGSPVHAGEVLAELESADLAAAVTDNQGGVAQAQASYDAAVQKAQQDLQLTKETLDSAQRLFDSRQALYKQGAAAAKDVDDARLSLLQAQDQYQAAQKQLDLKVAEGQLNSAIHGRVYGFFQDAALNSAPYAGHFTNGAPAFLPNTPPYSQYRVGGYLGGRIIKNKLFFFGGFEDLNNSATATLGITQYWINQGNPISSRRATLCGRTLSRPIGTSTIATGCLSATIPPIRRCTTAPAKSGSAATINRCGCCKAGDSTPAPFGA